MILDGTGHRGRSFACADDDEAALRRRRKVGRHAPRRLRGRDGGIEQCAQKGGWVGDFHGTRVSNTA
jgi:hypothetical protein